MSEIDIRKTASKRAIQKRAKSASDLNGNKIAVKITSDLLRNALRSSTTSQTKDMIPS